MDHDLCTSGREESKPCCCTAGVCRLRLWGSGFDGGFSFFCVCFLLKFLPLPSHPLSSNVLAKFYIASSCCVILNQWALILLLKHCGLYWGKNKKKPVTFKAVCFFLRGGRRVGCGSGGTLPLPFSLLWRKKKKVKLSVTEIQSCGF